MARECGRKDIGGHSLPWSEDTGILSRPAEIPGEGFTLKNPIVVQPLEGADALPDGAPGDLTRRRYRRFFESGAGLVWLESLAVQEDGRGNPHSLWINEGNLDAYKAFVDELKRDFPDVPLIAQLTHSGRFSAPHGKIEPLIAQYNPHYNARVNLPPDYPVVSDDYLERTSEAFVRAADLCRRAGFDGVDVKACHGYLFSDLLSSRTRPGRFGGSFENRARMTFQTIEAVKAQQGAGFIVACRICHADTMPYPYGFGMRDDGSLAYDPAETLQLVEGLRRRGVNLVNVSVGRVTVNPDFWNRPEPIPQDTDADVFERFRQGPALLCREFPDMTFVGSGYTLLKEDGPQVAAGALAAGEASLVGFGRQALAYPGFARAAAAGEFDRLCACTLCGNCYKLLRAFEPTGCPTRDREVYLPLLRKMLAR